MHVLRQDFWFIGAPFGNFIFPNADYEVFCREDLAFTVMASSIPVGASTPSVPESTRRGSRLAGDGGQGLSHEIPDPCTGPSGSQAEPSSAWSAAGASSSSSSVLRSAEYWISDTIPVITDRDISAYTVSMRDRTLYSALPEDMDQVYFLQPIAGPVG